MELDPEAKARNQKELVEILKQLPDKKDQIDVLVYVTGLLEKDRFYFSQAVEQVQGFVDLKNEDPSWKFRDYVKMGQFAGERTLKDVKKKGDERLRKPAPQVVITPEDLNKVSIQLGIQEETSRGMQLPPKPEPAKPVPKPMPVQRSVPKPAPLPAKPQTIKPLEQIVQPVPISKQQTVEMPPPEMPRKPSDLDRITMDGTVTKYLFDRQRFAPVTDEKGKVKDMGAGMGSVIRYVDKAFDREVIRKMPKVEKPEYPGPDAEEIDLNIYQDRLREYQDDIAVFNREMRINGSLVHANIVAVYEMGIDRKTGKPYFDQQKIDGKPLEDIINDLKEGKTKTFDLRRRVQIIADICKAMMYAHTYEEKDKEHGKKKVIHRDLKPGNIMVGKNGVTYVIDWGLAKYLDEKEDKQVHGGAKSSEQLKQKAIAEAKGKEDTYKTMGQGIIKGTISYMAPEQAGAEDVDEKSDQYSIGAILYETVTGEDFRQFLAKDPMQKVMMIAGNKYPFIPPRVANKNTPAELESIILKATQYDKRKRYPSVQHMLNDLEAWLSGKYVSAHNYGPIETAQKKIQNQSKKAVAIELTIAALLLAGSVGGVLYGQKKSADARAAEANVTAVNKAKEASDARADAETARANAAQKEADKNAAEAKLATTLKEQLAQEKRRSRAAELYWKGEMYLKVRNFDKAIATFNESRNKDEKWNNPEFGTGVAYYEMRDRDKAMQFFELANKKSLELSKRIDARALYYSAMTVIDQYDDPEKATPILEELVSKSESKDEPYVLLGRSILAFNQKNFREMFSLLDKVLEEQRMPEALYLRGICKSQGVPGAHAFNRSELKEFRDWKGAVTDLSEAIEADPGKWRPVNIRCLAYNGLEEFDLALKDADRLIEMKVRHIVKYSNKARILLNKGQYDDVFKVFREAEMEFGSLDETCLRTRGITYMNLNRFGEAESDLSKVIDKYHEWHDYKNRGIARMQLNKNDEAIQDFSEVISKGFAVGYFYRGKAYITKDMAKEAAKDLEAYLKTGDQQNRAEAEKLLDNIRKQ